MRRWAALLLTLVGFAGATPAPAAVRAGDPGTPGAPPLAAPAPAALRQASRVPIAPGPPERDPLVPMIREMNRYLQRHEADGVTMDSRYAVNPSEAIRQSVVCQVLAYVELYRTRPGGHFRREIVEHADYLVAHLAPVRSGTPFDGMLAFCLLEAYDVTRQARYLAAGQDVVDELKAIPTSECVLNGGLMVAMAMVEYDHLLGDAVAAQKARDILSSLAAYQHTDGSFPHWCICSRDIHYTGWMAMELVHIQRITGDPAIEPILARMHAFLDDRIDASGHTHYEGPCPPAAGVDPTGCVMYYDSRRSGCGIDYDTRGWTVEPAYTSLVFDHFGSPKYLAVMRFMRTLDHGGTFADKWDFIPPPDDPEYVWSVADTSIANMSIIFWAWATVLHGRGPLSPADAALLDDDGGDDAGAPVAGGPHRTAPPTAVAPDRGHVVDRLLAAGESATNYCDNTAAAAA
ncbi:MAG TPA: hypothetical protein VGU27_11065, partial [Candidatus Eisenbacteria bacterium]|nr:hypothetical protein [Candidatus Eisenbacteria bacterium]